MPVILGSDRKQQIRVEARVQGNRRATVKTKWGVGGSEGGGGGERCEWSIKREKGSGYLIVSAV